MEKSQRLISLDVFRGLTIAGMILVNNPGSWSNIYPSLAHAKWHGVTPTDLIFPFFLFIVGVAITLSLGKKLNSGAPKKELYIAIVKRSVLIFLVGLFLNGFPYFNFSEIRILGVLQRIAIVYLFASIIYVNTTVKSQIFFTFFFLILYWLLMAVIPVPGVGYANYEIGKNLSAYIDSLLLSGHMWVYTKTWDPEGILSTIPAISTCLSGILLGHWLNTKKDHATKVAWMFVVGNFALLISMFWDMSFPINKNIWTSSYVMYTSGMALIFFAICYWLIDVQNSKFWTKPFVVYGMNAIAVYFLSGIVSKLLVIIKIPVSVPETATIKEVALKTYIYEAVFTPVFSPVNASLAWSLFYVIFWLGIMWIFYKKKIFIKL